VRSTCTSIFDLTFVLLPARFAALAQYLWSHIRYTTRQVRSTWTSIFDLIFVILPVRWAALAQVSLISYSFYYPPRAQHLHKYLWSHIRSTTRQVRSTCTVSLISHSFYYPPRAQHLHKYLWSHIHYTTRQVRSTWTSIFDLIFVILPVRWAALAKVSLISYSFYYPPRAQHLHKYLSKMLGSWRCSSGSARTGSFVNKLEIYVASPVM
jgi:hypothetical protein